MSAPTPGRLARDAWHVAHHGAAPPPESWDRHLSDRDRQRWEGIAAAGSAPLREQLGALADELDRLAGEHAQKAAEYDRDRESFHRGCSAALGNAGGRIRHLIAAQEPKP